MNYRTAITLILIGLMLFASCRSKKELSLPKQQERFLNVYVELQRLRDRLPDQVVSKDSSKAIIQKHGFTQAEFQRSLAYFNEKPERWEAFYKEAQKRLEKNIIK